MQSIARVQITQSFPFSIAMPQGSHILSLEDDKWHVLLHFLGDYANPMETRNFQCFTYGQIVPDDMMYVTSFTFGTVLYHMFEGLTNEPLAMVAQSMASEPTESGDATKPGDATEPAPAIVSH